MGKTITVAEAAAKLGCNMQRVRALLGDRRIPNAKLVGRQWFIPEDFVVTPAKHGPKLRK